MRPSVFITQPVARSATERLRLIADVQCNPAVIQAYLGTKT